MSLQVCMGAQLTCTFGVAPSQLIVPPANKTLTITPDATIMDNKPIVNIPPFGMCSSIANPQVASATTAALGVLTPMPCLPVIPAPWTPGSPTVLIGGQPALNNLSVCNCTWGGVIQIAGAGQQDTVVP